MKNNKDSKNMQLATTILLNRILQTSKSPARKSRKEIAIKYSCSADKVGRAERYILEKLSTKIAVLKILLQIK